jgi:hypothetical protein
VQREVGSVLERAQVHRRRGRGVDEHARGRRDGGVEVGMVRNGFEGASARSGLRPPAAARSGRTRSTARPSGRGRRTARRPVVGALGQRDRLVRLEQREHDRGRGSGPGGEEQRLAALELAERALGRDAVRVRVALVVVLARLAVAVRPDRRAVERLTARTLVSDGSSLTPPRLYLISSNSVDKLKYKEPE